MSLRYRELQKSFGSHHVLQGVSFEVQAGETVFVLGRSGVGKSVLLKCTVGLQKIDSGQILLNERPIQDLGEDELGEVRTQCGMVFQKPALLDSLNIFDNIAFGIRTSKIRDRVHEVLALVGLESEILKLRPSQISVGMQKRVSLARTLAPRPEFLLYDEPTTGLDPQSTRQINQLIIDLARSEKTGSIVVSHDMNCALQAADRIILLDEGKIAFKGDVEQTVQSTHPLVRAFMAETLELLSPAEKTRLGITAEGPSP